MRHPAHRKERRMHAADRRNGVAARRVPDQLHNPERRARMTDPRQTDRRRHAAQPPRLEARRRNSARERRHLGRRVLALGLGFVACLFSSNLAFAYLTSTGTGSGSGSVGTFTMVTVATAGSPSTPLFPDGTGDVTLRVDNQNSFAVTLVSITGDGTITPDGAHSSCSPTGVTFTNQTGLDTSMPANTTVSVDLAGAASMNATSPNRCQGATFTIPVTITVHEG